MNMVGISKTDSAGQALSEEDVFGEDTSTTQKTVLIISHNHPSFFPGGAEIFAYDLFKAINAGGRYNAFFLAGVAGENREMRPGTPFQTVGKASNEILFWGSSFDFFYQSQQQSHLLYVYLRDLLAQLKPDIVHFQHTLRIGLEALHVVKNTLPNAKIFYTIHEYILMCNNFGQMVFKHNGGLCEYALPDRCSRCFPEFTPQHFKMRELFIKSHLELVDKFISPSHFLANRFVEWGLPKEKMTVLENGRRLQPQAPFRSLSSTEDTRNRFGYFGQVNPFKGVLLVLKAVEHLLNHGFDDFRLEIFGGMGSGFPEFEKKFSEILNKHQDNVVYHGRYKQEEIPELIGLVDWVIVPSTWWENSPLVIQEVFMHKRPIICSNIGGMAEKVEDGKTGLHFRVRNHTNLAEKIKYAVSNESLWETLVSNIGSRLSIEEAASLHIDMYENLSQKAFRYYSSD